jgi:hypothetical protein
LGSGILSKDFISSHLFDEVTEDFKFVVWRVEISRTCKAEAEFAQLINQPVSDHRLPTRESKPKRLIERPPASSQQSGNYRKPLIRGKDTKPASRLPLEDYCMKYDPKEARISCNIGRYHNEQGTSGSIKPRNIELAGV